MQINSMNIPDPTIGKPPTYTIVTEWFTLQDVPAQTLDLLGVVLMSLPIPRKYTDPVINTIIQQVNDQNQAYAIQYARNSQANYETEEYARRQLEKTGAIPSPDYPRTVS